jgi:hypothetical protein
MKDLTRETIGALLAADETELKVTIYIPMHVSGSPPHMTEDQIRFKNLLHKAAEGLKAKYNDKELGEQLLSQIDKRMDDLTFWESQTEGLLICARRGAIELFHLPVDTEEYVAVDTCYHLAPVLALLGDEQSFYILTVTQHHPQLLSGNMYGLFEMKVGMPKNLEDSLNIDERNQRSEQSQSLGNGTGFNGRGGIRDPRQEERLRFFRLVDSVAYNAAERSLPLILAGTETETAEYRHLSKYPNIMAKTIAGSFSNAKPHDLFERAYKIIHDDLIAVRRQQAVETYERLQGTQKERTTTDPLTIAEAAKQGRIDTLLVALRRSTADTVRDTAQTVERITFPRAELSTLINKAANAVASARGHIVNVELGAAQSGASVMATLRY